MGADEVAVAPWPLLLHRRLAERARASTRFPWVVLATVLFGLGTVGATITLLAVSIPSIADDLGAADSTLTWVITGPLLVFGVVGPALGKAADRYGHRRLFLVGMTGAMVFAGLTAVAWSAASLIAFRVLGAGLGAAAGPASLALINSVFPPDQRVKALGFWSMVAAGAPVLGVVVGGPVVEAFGWRWIFLAQVPLILVGIVWAAAVLPETERRDGGRFDVLGAVTLAVTVTSLLFALNRGTAWGWSNPVVVLGFALVPIAGAAFLAVERRAADPLIPLRYWRRRNFAAPVVTQFFTNFAYMGGFIITPLLLQDVLGYGETRTGLLSIFRPLTFSIAGPLAGFVTVRVGERAAGVGGALIVAASMVGLATVAPGTSDLVIIGALALSGLGLGWSSPAMAASIANSVSEDDLGVAGATQQLVSQVGVVAGIQIMQTVQLGRVDAVGLAASYHQAYLVGAAVCLLGALTASFVRSSAR
ncbi:MAG: MFS transporter [Acidimicrobiales bacterium]|nr:MFS transporter [Acidimicrobiales bacterium]